MEQRLQSLQLFSILIYFQLFSIYSWINFDMHNTFLFSFCQGSYAGYLYTFALKSKVHFSSREGAFLSALFWVSNVVFRVIYSRHWIPKRHSCLYSPFYFSGSFRCRSFYFYSTGYFYQTRQNGFHKSCKYANLVDCNLMFPLYIT